MPWNIRAVENRLVSNNMKNPTEDEQNCPLCILTAALEGQPPQRWLDLCWFASGLVDDDQLCDSHRAKQVNLVKGVLTASAQGKTGILRMLAREKTNVE